MKKITINRDRAERVRQVEDQVSQYTSHVKKLKEKAKTKQQEAQAQVPLTEARKEAFADMPESLEELQALIDIKTAEAEGLMVNDPGALQRYNQRCEEIRKGDAELAELNEQRAATREQIDSDKALWLPELKRIVECINATFSINFAAVGTAGEVVLHEAPDEDFDNYAIEIRVKFRENEALQTLDANRQSGGERSVSTIIFLVALQVISLVFLVGGVFSQYFPCTVSDL